MRWGTRLKILQVTSISGFWGYERGPTTVGTGVDTEGERHLLSGYLVPQSLLEPRPLRPGCCEPIDCCNHVVLKSLAQVDLLHVPEDNRKVLDT